MTLKQAAQQAIDVQDACNGSGVARALVRVIDVIRESASYTGTSYSNQHPIVYLFAYKLMALAGREPLSDDAYYWQMMAECQKIVDAVEVAPDPATESTDDLGYEGLR